MSELDSPALSICIPTFNRSDLVCGLVDTILSSRGNFELLVHVDGSEDDTFSRLSTICDHKLKLSLSENRGRAASLRHLVNDSLGKFIMIFDDDDCIYPSGLSAILKDCSLNLDVGVGGYIYGMDIDGVDDFHEVHARPRSNLLKLRADERLCGDKKEVILGSIMKKLVDHMPNGYRRVPTSLLWAVHAIQYDVVCRNMVVGMKRYHADGLTHNIRKLKVENSYPMLMLYRARSYGYIVRRYRSFRYFFRSLMGLVYYSAVFSITKILR